MAKYVKVTLPKDKPKESVELGDAIILKNTAEGAGSSLAPVIDVADFTAKVTLAKTKRASATAKEVDAQSKFGHIKTKSGLGENQNKDTKDVILWYVRQARDLLLVIHSGNEEDLSPYGFNVVITTSGGRKNVRVDIPEQPVELIELAEAIVAQHTLLGAGSPLTAALIDMAAFGTLVTDARTLLDAWTVLRGEIQALNNEALNIIGYGEGQKITTEGTIYNYFGKIRNRLLQKFQGNEEDLSLWGFKVVISSKRNKKGNSGISISGTISDSNSGAPIGGALLLVAEPDIFVVTDSQGKYEVPGLASGTYTLVAHKGGYAEKEITGVVVTAGQTTTVNIQITPAGGSATGTVAGTVKQGGTGAPGTVSIDGTAFTVPTDGAGGYIIPGVPPGNYTMRAALDSNPANFLTQNVTVVEGAAPTVVNFNFP